MRRTLLVIVMLFTTVQVLAANVTLDVNDIGGGLAAIRYSADANVSAFGLRIYTDSDAIITEINDFNIGECTASQKGYGIFPGTIVIDESNGVIESNGTPIAPNDAPGAAGTGLDTNTIIVEMGALYAADSCQPDTSGTLLTVKVDKDCNVCVEGESIRGNVVFIDGTSVDPCVVCEPIILACYTGPDYAEWVTVGKPDSWCNPRQCHGDADGLENTYGSAPPPIVPWPKSWVTKEDLTILVSGYQDQNYVDPATDPWISADFNHQENTYGSAPPPIVPWPSARVTKDDLTILVGYYQDQSGIPTDCLD